MWVGLTARWPVASTGNRLVILKMEAICSNETAEHAVTTQCKTQKAAIILLSEILRHFCGCEVLMETVTL